ncbi:MAG: hypothetical protein LBK53_08515 [Heliobacteriaceae bacterium]|jgi:hydroxylamine reductase|nr:hypothetical protein [Heliobacteriaceae bacterium]
MLTDLNNLDFSECTFHGVCTVPPNASSLQEAMIILLRQIAFYILKLEGLGIKQEEIITNIIEEIAAIDVLGDYSEQQTLNIFSKFYAEFINLKKLYTDKCKANNISCKKIKNKIILTSDTNLSAIITQGEKVFKERYGKVSEKQRELSGILWGVMKGVCSNIITYKDLDRVYEPACHSILHALHLFGDAKVSAAKMMSQITGLTELNLELLKLIYNAETELYGETDNVRVSLSTRPGKAIMVSGSSLTDLYSVLKMTRDKNIDVYSNGNLIIAHTYPKLREFDNFKGHFGVQHGTVLDFANFPGAILLTKNEAQNIEYLYRGRIFTTDFAAPKGVTQISSDNLSPLLESAMNARGFRTGRSKDFVSIGFNRKELDEQIAEIAEKFKAGIYKHLILAGFSDDSERQAEYFKKLFSKIPDDAFLISFSYQADCENCLTLNAARSYSLIYSISEQLFSKIQINPANVSIFLSRCDVRSLSNIISFKNKGFKNIFLSNCSPGIINPATLKAFRRIFNIMETSTPKKDLEIIFS